MKNGLKAQQEFLRAVYYRRRAGVYTLGGDDDRVMFTVNGYVGYVVPASELLVKSREMPRPCRFDLVRLCRPDWALTPTNTYEKDGTVRGYAFPGEATPSRYVDQKLLHLFHEPRLFADPASKHGVIAVYEPRKGAPDELVLAGCVLPMNIR